MAVTLREVSTHLDAIEAQLRVDPRSVAIAFDNLVAAGRTRSQALAVLQAQFERTPKHIERLIRDGRKLLKTLGADS